jgi:DNA-binding transcriptional regulator YiaG
MDKFLAIQNRFWSKVEKKEAGECWNWQCGKGWNGYGQFFIDKKNIRAHRFSYELHHNRKITPGLIVMHTCDNRACVNPAHLVEGTVHENIQDKVNKNRQSRLPGERNGNSKLTEQQVLEIREKIDKSNQELAELYNISKRNIHQIISRKRWSHI